MTRPNSTKNAESIFREAFERLKLDCPEKLAKGSPLSQNNVAKEAGRDPSALRKSRYPELIDEIKLWISNRNQIAARLPEKLTPKKRRRIRLILDRIVELRAQRDIALSLLNEANAKIIDLVMENRRFSETSNTSNVTLLSAKTNKAR